LYEGLDNIFALRNLQTPSFKFSQVVFAPLQNFSSIDDDHKKLSLPKETDFKIEAKTLNTWIFLNTYPNDMKFLTYIFLYDLYDPKAADSKKFKQRRYDQKINMA